MKNPFSEAELEQIRQAVARAERRTAGEIVPYIVDRSGRYDVAVWRGAALFAIVGIAAALLLLRFYTGWGLAWLYSGWGTALVTLAAGTLGAFLTAFIPSLKRLLAGSGLLDRTVHQRAMQAFVEEEVFNTRERTGILLFISLFEHRIEVLGDAGINRNVSIDEWADVVTRVRDGIKSGHLVDGLVEAMEMCGHLLERCGVEIRPDDLNELSDQVRIRRGVE